MIRKLKNEIRRFVDGRVRLIKDQQYNNQQTALNYTQLSQLFSEDHFIPFTAWAISPNTILHVLNDITINKRKNIIEFGSGASTFFIAKLIKVLNIDAVFFSVESDEKWAAEMERQLALYNLENLVKIIYAPLEGVPDNLSYKEQKSWYSVKVLQENFKNLSSVDLVLVDGPGGRSSPYARYSAIPFLKEKFSQNYSIFLDDINRSQEKEIAGEWQDILKKDIKFIDRYAVIASSSTFDVTPLKLTRFP